MDYRYYATALRGDARQNYEDIRRGLAAMESAIRTPLTDVRTLSDILFCVRLDDPRLAFVKDAVFRGARGAEHVEVVPKYAFEPQKMRTHLASIEPRLKKITAPARSLSEEERVRFVHDWLIGNVRYDKLYKNYAHEVLGPLCHGVGVCEGIAKTAKVMFDELGIESLIVIGREREGGHGVDGMRHAWNIVRLGGKRYHMDATFDLSLSRCGVTRYDYYLLSDRQIYADHREPVWPVPACTAEDRAYYRENRQTVESPEALGKYLARAGKKRSSVFLFQYGEGVTLEQIAPVCRDFAAERGKLPRLSHNPGRRTVLFTLKDADDAEKELSVDVLPD